MTQTAGRLGHIDFIKCIALAGIILAHADSPGAVMMLRSFDVPCMVILSSLLASHSYRKHCADRAAIFHYLLSRFKRLVFPTWIFLTLYFGLHWVFSGHPYDVNYYLASYFLTRYGIGYVWIILVYLYCALLVPLFHKTGWNRRSVCTVAALYLLYEAAYWLRLGTDSRLLVSTFYYMIPYGSIAFLGYHYTGMKTATKYRIALASFLVFVSFAVYYRVGTGAFRLVQISKYPPRLYYLSFGVLGTFALLIPGEKFNCGWFGHPAIRFVSTHTLWIYLWHILWLTLYDVFRLPAVWLVKFPIVFAGAALTVVFVNKLLDLIEKKVRPGFFRYLRG